MIEFFLFGIVVGLISITLAALDIQTSIKIEVGSRIEKEISQDNLLRQFEINAGKAGRVISITIKGGPMHEAPTIQGLGEEQVHAVLFLQEKKLHLRFEPITSRSHGGNSTIELTLTLIQFNENVYHTLVHLKNFGSFREDIS